MISHPTLTIVVPCYNESEVFKASSLALTNVLSILISKGKISNNSNVLFVDDGSRDDTWNKIITESLNITNVKGIKVSRNVGHQAALLAGLTYSKASDITISIDADLRMMYLSLKSW